MRLKAKEMAERITRHAFTRYALLGGGSLLLTLFFTWLLTDQCGLFYLWSYIIVLGAVVVVNFIAASRFVFHTGNHHGRRFVYYIISLGLLYLADVMLVRFLTASLGLFYLTSALFARVFFFLLKYVYYRRVLFNPDSFLYTEKMNG
ncbi:MAG: GtrA family protein [Acidobacteriota bacterium]|jgi:putative flippase GtrA|nr:GtrA family protein [Acidobacteriota bacterium]